MGTGRHILFLQMVARGIYEQPGTERTGPVVTTSVTFILFTIAKSVVKGFLWRGMETEGICWVGRCVFLLPVYYLDNASPSAFSFLVLPSHACTGTYLPIPSPPDLQPCVCPRLCLAPTLPSTSTPSNLSLHPPCIAGKKAWQASPTQHALDLFPTRAMPTPLLPSLLVLPFLPSPTSGHVLSCWDHGCISPRYRLLMLYVLCMVFSL